MEQVKPSRMGHDVSVEVSSTECPGGIDMRTRARLLSDHRRNTAWVPFAVIALGVWALSAPLTLFFAIPAAPAGGREIWLSDTTREALTASSAVIAGFVLAACGIACLGRRSRRPMWLAAAAGAMLLFCPVLFWSPSSTSYLRDTSIGALAIVFGVLIPGMPGLLGYAFPGPMAPPGWSYNPSSLARRLAKAAPALVGWILARDMAAYQFGFLTQIWDPFFGDGSMQVLTSRVSESLPVADAALGAFAYGMDFLLVLLGPAERWRAAPFIVLLNSAFILPTAAAAVFLAVAQALIVGRWCFLCLASSAVMLPLVPMILDELAATLQFLRGRPFLRTLFMGGELKVADRAQPAPHLVEFGRVPGMAFKSAFRGISLTWNLLLLIGLGVWLMFAPVLFGGPETITTGAYLSGPILIVIAATAASEIARAIRFTAVVPGVGLIVTALFGGVSPAAVNAVVCGVAVIMLALPRGRIRECYGTLQKIII